MMAPLVLLHDLKTRESRQEKRHWNIDDDREQADDDLFRFAFHAGMQANTIRLGESDVRCF